MSYRTSFILLLAVLAGFCAWASWLGISVSAILLFFSFLLLVGFVAAKFRAECGLPAGYFTPYNAMLFVSLVGGMRAFGSEGMLVCLVASGFLSVSVFFFIPGAQMELLEYTRRYRMQPRHALYTVLLGIAGGLLIGGWVFLSNAYALGGDNIKYQWAFNQDWFFNSYRSELATASAPATDSDSIWSQPRIWGYGLAGAGAIILTVLRQLFAGFWFHPIGFILGSAHMMEFVWGSVTVALLLRFVVLKLGGAATVRHKLMPFAVGLFVGSVTAMLFFNLLAAWLQQHGVERIFGGLP